VYCLTISAHLAGPAGIKNLSLLLFLSFGFLRAFTSGTAALLISWRGRMSTLIQDEILSVVGDHRGPFCI
jgi:hypothetical protein